MKQLYRPLVGLAVVMAVGVLQGSAAPEPPPQAINVTTLVGVAPTTPLVDARAIEAGPGGELFIYESGNAVIQRRTAEGDLVLLAGLPGHAGTVDGTGTAARIDYGQGMARGADGTLYFAETNSHTIRKVTTAGVVTTIAGTAGQLGSTDGTGAAARFSSPAGLIVDAAGIIYVADTANHTIRRIGLDGTVTTLAGSAPSTDPFSGAGTANGSGAEARFNRPVDIALGTTGDLFVVERGNYRVRRVTPAGVVTSVAGDPGQYGAVDGTGTAARFGTVSRIIHAGGDTFYVADVADQGSGMGPCTIRVVTAAGVVTTYPSLALNSGSCQGAGSLWPVDMTLQDGGGVWALMGFTGALWRPTSVATGLTSLSASGQATVIWSHTNQPGGQPGGGGSPFLAPHSIALGQGEFAVFSLPEVSRHYSVTGTGINLFASGHVGVIHNDSLYSVVGCRVANLAGHLQECGYVDGSPGTARFSRARGLAVDSAGTFYIADTDNHAIRKMTAAGVVTTLAGNGGTAGSADGVGTAATFNSPVGLTVDSAGVVYVGDTGNHTVRRIATDGAVTTIAGSAGVTGSADGAGTDARFFAPTGIVIDAGGVLVVSDRWNHTVREISTSGAVTTLAGSAGAFGSTDGSGATARFREPQGLAIDGAGTVLVADTRNHTVRVIERSARSVPSITTQPAHATTPAGQGAFVDFSIVASGVPMVSYQWQVSSNGGATWANVPECCRFNGQTKSRLRVSNLTAADNGLRYRVVLTNAAGSTTSNSTTLTVHHLLVTPVRLRFGAVRPTSTAAPTVVTGPQTVALSYAASAAPVWTATANQAWVEITGGSGTGAGQFTVGIVNAQSAFVNGPNPTATVTVSAPNVGLTTTFPISFSVTTGAASAAPLGNFDTPVNGTTGLEGAIVVSGWALDDIGVDRVEIWRDLVPGESTPPYGGPGPGNGRVFVANGLFGSGTRPDVETLYTQIHPNARASGWGYMLLTYGFPDRGNGTYTLRAFAFDAEGQYTALGVKTITVNNNAAVKPFGTLDYPEQSGTVSGTYTAVGWVLTPNVNGVPTCTFDHIVMELDSNQVYIPVTYGLSRPDVTDAFPGLSTSSAPGASAAFDSTTFTNGIHTIGWLAYDTCGRGEGIGSRFIDISNTGGGDTAVRATRDLRAVGLEAPIAARQTVRVDVMERAEVTLPAIEGATWTGREMVLGEARQLPIGSSLDSVTGRFAWRPMAGFFGTFDLRFVAHVNGAAVAQVPVRVVVGPGVRLAVDMPTSHEQVPGVFTIAGWAADLGASEGTGIDAIHVWAYPAEGGDPIFAGHAGLGAPREDVSAVYGAQFAASGYYLTVGHLPRGWYDIVVYPHSAVDGEFRGARVVRVLVR